jgi:hypothetical protein
MADLISLDALTYHNRSDAAEFPKWEDAISVLGMNGYSELLTTKVHCLPQGPDCKT